MEDIKSFIKEHLNSERTTEAYRRLSDAYLLRETDRPAIVERIGKRFMHIPFEMAKSPEKNLEEQFAKMKANLQIGSDYAPMLEAALPFGTVMVPDAFGCKVEWTPDVPPWAKPLISSPQDVYSIKKPKLSECTIIQEIKKHVEYMQKIIGPDAPLQVIDMQGPFSVACQIWDAEEMMMACITHPKEVHHFLRIVTDFSIEFIKEYISWLGNPLFPGRNFPSIPENIGPNIADDTPLVMLSPAKYEEFALPYNIEVAEAFGGLSIHSCGEYNFQLDNLLKIPNLRAIQCHVGPGEMQPDPLFEKVNGKVALWCDWNNVALGTYENAKTMYEEYTMPYFRQLKRGLIVMGIGGDDMEQRKENYQWLAKELG